MTNLAEADYVIVGAGSAGCVLANRLSADPAVSVILIEAGGDDRPSKNRAQFRTNMMIHVPVGFAEAMNDPAIRWDLTTDAEPSAGQRELPVIRAKVLGGCSSINAMLYVRGERSDYDSWRQLGCTGWSWEDVLPYFRKAQHQERGPDEWHGVNGPLNVSNNQGLFDVSRRVLEAAALAGIPTRTDTNNGEQFGAVSPQVTIRKGWRNSAAVAYLHPAMARANLTVLTSALTTRILFEGGRATGVAFTRDGQEQTVKARREVILAGGAIASPHLLHLSGIGPAERLTALGIPVVVDSPKVGEDLQDHYMSFVSFELKPGVRSLNSLTKGLPLAGQALRYLLTRKGLLAESAAQVLIYAKSREGIEDADIQYSITPGSMKKPVPGQTRMVMDETPGLTFGPCQLRPHSRGYVRARSADPRTPPLIRFNYLTDPIDCAVQVMGVRIARQIAAQAPLADLMRGERLPGAQAESDEDILDYIRETGNTVYHPVGTVAMGEVGSAPLDSRLRVRGVDGLRVVDASVMPRLISGNTNAPVIMIAEKASEMILADARAIA